MTIPTMRIIRSFVFLIPIIFAIAENTTGYFSGRSLNPGTIRGVITALFLFYFVLKLYPTDTLNKIILLYVIYFFVLCLISSDYTESFYGFFRFFIATLMFPVGYVFINSYEKFQRLNRLFFVALCLFIINIIIANIFNLGTSDYLEDSFYFGAGRVNITKIMLIILFASINLIPALKGKHKRIFIAILFIAAFITIVGIKRSVLLSFGVSALMYLRFSRLKKGFVSIIMPILFGVLFSLLVYPKALNIMESRLLAREERISLDEETIETEGRVSETALVIESWINGDIFHKLFGSELFNDRFFFNSKRMLHTDYMVVLNGSGIIGLILWFVILFGIFLKGNRYLKYYLSDPRFPFLQASFYSIIISQLFMSISGSIQGIGLRSYILLYLGAIVGTLRGELIHLKSTYLRTNND